jgi:hypothetical protein
MNSVTSKWLVVNFQSTHAWLVFIPRVSSSKGELGTDKQAGILKDAHDEHPAGDPTV